MERNMNLKPHERYALISELAYSIGEDHRKSGLAPDPARDWLEAQSTVDQNMVYTPAKLLRFPMHG